jgi:transposase
LAQFRLEPDLKLADCPRCICSSAAFDYGESQVVEHLPAYCPHLNPDERVWNHAKARLSKCFVATKEEFKAALFSIMLSIQRSTELILSFFKLPDTKYAARVKY